MIKLGRLLSDFFIDAYYWICSAYKDSVYWVKSRLRKTWLDLFKTVLSDKCFDYYYLLKLERSKILDLIACKEKDKYHDNEDDLRHMKLAVKMLDIMMNDLDLFHYDGDCDFIKNENGTYSLDGDMKYVCDVNVNKRNYKRFGISKDICDKMPHELYFRKATNIYYKLRYYFTYEWWC